MIKNYTKLFLVSFSLLLLASCATTPTRHSLNNQDKVSIKSSRILLNTTQREIVMQHNNWFHSDLADPYAPMDSGAIVKHNAPVNPNNGLIGALIVSGIQHSQAGSAIKSMAPVRMTLENFDFIAYFNSELHNHVAQLSWLKVKKQEIKYNVQGSELDNVVAANENTTLFIGTTYAFNSVFRQLEVATYVKLIEKPVGNQTPRTLYTNNFFFVNRLSEPNTNANENKARWLANNGAMLKTKLRDAASLLSKMIVMDIDNKSYTPANDQLITIRTVEGAKMQGKLIKRLNGYYLILLSNKTLYAINSSDIVT